MHGVRKKTKKASEAATFHSQKEKHNPTNKREPLFLIFFRIEFRGW